MSPWDVYLHLPLNHSEPCHNQLTFFFSEMSVYASFLYLRKSLSGMFGALVLSAVIDF